MRPNYFMVRPSLSFLDLDEDREGRKSINFSLQFNRMRRHRDDMSRKFFRSILISLLRIHLSYSALCSHTLCVLVYCPLP